MRTAGVLLTVITLGVSGATTVQSQTSASDEPLEAVDLPVSLERIRNQLERLPVAQSEQDVLRLNFYVRVYGRAPDVELFEGYDLHNGPVPYGTPTHADMRELISPVQVSTPGRQFGNVIGWAWRRGPYR